MRRTVRRTHVAVALAAAAALLAGPPAQARPPVHTDPVVERLLAGVGADETVTVLVTLRERAVASTSGRARGERRETLVRGLRSRAGASQASLQSRLARLQRDGEVTRTTALWVTNAVSVTGTPEVVRELARRADVASVRADAVTVVVPDVPAEPGIATTGAPQLWAQGRTGDGVVVASLDSGADLGNPDLAASWRGGTNSWFDPFGQHPEGPVDLSGHGTATLGVMVGGHDAGTSYGMAPGAQWVAARVFDDRGASSATAIHQAFQWVLDPDHDPATDDAPDVVNASWALGGGPGCDLQFQPDVAALRAAGILPVVAAGNFGSGAGTSASPANYPESFAVGAVDSSDRLWSSSSAGPTTCGSRSRVFPDVVAPGVSVLAADRWGGYQYVSGTSVAAPHVAGALALLLQGRRGLTPDLQAEALTASAVDLGDVGPDERFGHGRLDVVAAETRLEAAPDFSVAVDPGGLTVPAGRAVVAQVTLERLHAFDAAVALSVSGAEAFGGTAALTPVTLTGARRTAVLRIRVPLAAGGGVYPLTVTATGGGLTHTTTVDLGVIPAPDFSVSPGSDAVTVRRGHDVTIPVAVGGLGGWTGPVRLSSAARARGVGAVLADRNVAAPGETTMRVRAGRGARLGTYTVVVTGRVGRVVHQATVTVTVTP